MTTFTTRSLAPRRLDVTHITVGRHVATYSTLCGRCGAAEEGVVQGPSAEEEARFLVDMALATCCR